MVIKKVIPSHLLDTNVCISLLRGGDVGIRVFEKIRTFQVGELAVASITVAELAHGAERSTRTTECKRVRSLLKDFAVLDFDESCAWIYGKLRQKLTSDGQMIGGMDLLIASVALNHQLTLVTHNTGEFSRIETLRLEDWEGSR